MKRDRSSVIELIEEEWTCPITSMPIQDPVMTVDGHSYEKTDIEEWLKKKRTSPKTGLPLLSVITIPNLMLKNIIQKFETEVKYEYEKMSKQVEELREKNEKLMVQHKILNEENLKYKKEAFKVFELNKECDGLESLVKKLKEEIKRLESECMELKREKEKRPSYPSSQFNYNNLSRNINNISEKKEPPQVIQKQSEVVLPSCKSYLRNLPLVLYQETIKTLTHSHTPIDIDLFLLHDWSHLEVLNLVKCKINNEGFEKLANGMKYLKSLKTLSLGMNEITHIESETLQKFKHLKTISFSYLGQYGNPFDEETKQLLESFKRIYAGTSLELDPYKEEKKSEDSENEKKFAEQKKELKKSEECEIY